MGIGRTLIAMKDDKLGAFKLCFSNNLFYSRCDGAFVIGRTDTDRMDPSTEGCRGRLDRLD